MYKIAIFTQLDRINGGHTIIHKVRIPSPLENGRYRSVMSLNAFINGRRKNATKKEIADCTDGCSYSPKFLYHNVNYKHWIMENERYAELGHHDLDQRNLPSIEHSTIWDFYTHIGFDYKKRKYLKD